MNESSALESSGLERLAPWLWGALTLAVGLWIFYPILIWDADPELWSLPEAWLADENYSYGFLIPPLAAYFVWENQYRLSGVPLDGTRFGLAVIAAAFLIFAMGMLGGINYLPRASAVLLLMGGVLWIGGWRWGRVLAFPVLFLFLMIPIPRFAMIQIAFPLQVFAAEMAQRILFEIGIPIFRTGNVIHLAHVDLDVAEACSGLHSLLALITTGVVFAYFFGRTIPQRVTVVAMSIPIAILVNALRVAGTGYLAHSYGLETATGFYHMLQGFGMFGLAFALLALTGFLATKLIPGPRRMPV